MGAETEVTDDFKLSDRPVDGCLAKNEKSACCSLSLLVLCNIV